MTQALTPGGHTTGAKLLPAGAHVGFKTAPTDEALLIRVGPSVDQSKTFDRIVNQLLLGACVPHAGGEACAALLADQGIGSWDPSRLQLYRECLLADGTFPQDDGTFLETFINVAKTLGVGASDADYPYVDTDAAIAATPPADYAAKAAKVRLVNADPIALDRQSIMWELATNAKIIFAVSLHASYEQIGPDGIVPLPSGSDPVVGGHAQRGVGYGVDLDAKAPDYLKTANSWGRNWGRDGYCYWPWELLEDPTICRGIWSLRALQVVS